MDGFIKGIIDMLAHNPWFFTLLVGFVIGYIVGKR